jgi:EAL domain-containing protein (putative c-di-GMP-specific phosphodiesterase class I)
MKTGTVMGVEGLVRWVHPDKGVLPPSHFLPIIQDSEVELDFGRTIIQLGLEQLTDWQQSRTPLALSINISPQHLLSPNFVSELQQSLLAFSTVKPASLEFEILETGALNDIEQMQNVVQLCQTNIGISIALDDFGTGYSSLAHLRYLTAQTIKIDRAFVRDLLVDPSDYAIVESIIALAKAFNRSVIAEGVETIEQGEKLLEMGCELAQGYVIAKPMPIDELMDWLNDYKPVDSWIHHNA